MKRRRIKKLLKKTPLFWFAHLFQYVVFRALAWFFGSVSGPLLERIGRQVGLFFYYYYPRQRRTCIANLDRVFGKERGPHWVSKMAKEVYRHWGTAMAEVFWMFRRLDAGNWNKHVAVEGREHLDKALARGKGIVILAAHLGNWELAGCMLGLLGYSIYSIARTIENPLIHRWVLARRSMHGQRILDKEGALKEMVEALKNNGLVGILADQNAGSSGIFVDFFGKKASTTRSPAALAIKYGSPIVPLYVYRKRAGPEYVLGFEPELALNVSSYVEENIHAVTQQATAKLEELIRRRPEQWVWLHNRWRTRPREETRV
jgi:KDO2-lipid IV(A) lauroyltransferase